MKRFRGGLVFKASRLVYHSTLGLRVIKKKKKDLFEAGREARVGPHLRPDLERDLPIVRLVSGP